MGKSYEAKIFLKRCTIKNGSIKIPKSVFSYKGIKDLVLNEELQEIGKEAFENNKIKKLVMPDSIIKIEERAFQRNNINTLVISKNLDEISEGCFIDNDLVNLEIPENIKRLKTKCFRYNKLKNLKLNEGLLIIDEEAFYDNKLEKIEFPNSLNQIGLRAFERNQLKEIKFGNNLEIIKESAFRHNKIDKIDFNEKLIVIGNESFAFNQITDLKIPDSVRILGESCFRNNKLENVIISSNVEIISKHAFAFNNISKLKLNDKITIIEDSSFYNNNIETLILPNTLTSIGNYAFQNNKINSVIIPDSVTNIGKKVFDETTTITYKGITFSSHEISRFGTQNITKLALIRKLNPNFDFLNIDSFELDLIPFNNDSIKGYLQNRNRFIALQKKLYIRNNQGYDDLNSLYNFQKYDDLLKFCFTIGFFKSNGKQLDDIEAIIKWIYETYCILDIHSMISKLEFDKYNPKVASIMINAFKDPVDFEILKYTLIPFYNEYSRVSKGVLKVRENEITKLNTIKKRMINEGNDVTDIEKQIKELKRNLKNYSIIDVASFIKNNVFKVKSGNEDLLEIANILSGQINNYEFKEIENIFENAKNVYEKDVLKPVEGDNGDYTYEWLKNDDPRNLALGYLVDCCAKINGMGEDIMRQSMINPKVKNLVIYDSSKRIIGKTTAYYNNEQKYILCNNIEISKSFNNNKKTTNEMREEVLQTILKGLKKQIEIMDDEVDEVRIGLLRNDLLKELKNMALYIEHSYLLDNYNWRNYDGDANDKASGQAVVYKK